MTNIKALRKKYRIAYEKMIYYENQFCKYQQEFTKIRNELKIKGEFNFTKFVRGFKENGKKT